MEVKTEQAKIRGSDKTTHTHTTAGWTERMHIPHPPSSCCRSFAARSAPPSAKVGCVICSVSNCARILLVRILRCDYRVVHQIGCVERNPPSCMHEEQTRACWALRFWCALPSTVSLLRKCDEGPSTPASLAS